MMTVLKQSHRSLWLPALLLIVLGLSIQVWHHADALVHEGDELCQVCLHASSPAAASSAASVSLLWFAATLLVVARTGRVQSLRFKAFHSRAPPVYS